MADTLPWRFWMDTGGTFTDCLAQAPDGSWRRLKVLSSGAVRARVERVLGPKAVVLTGLPLGGAWAGYQMAAPQRQVSSTILAWEPQKRIATLAPGNSWQAGDVVDLSTGEEAPVLAMRVITATAPGVRMPAVELRLATTRGTNALLERSGAEVAFFVTEGFADLLRIGDQRRPDLFALRVQRPEPLHGPVVEVRGRLAADGSELVPLELVAVRGAAGELVARGVRSAAVALMHSYRNPAHEQAVAGVLREAGFAFVSVSAELAPFIKYVPRAETAVVDAVLAPVMESYLSGVAEAMDSARLWVMTSAGGLVRRSLYRSKDSLLSGPAGGVAGAVAVARRAGLGRIITFDMGGTSTDVARVDGDYEYQEQHAVGAARVVAPALRVESVAAGGGSICRFDGSALVVGPESAGARPGPACYGAGGPLTLTDVNLLLGRLDPTTFGIPIFADAAQRRLDEVIESMRRAGSAVTACEDVLRGFIAIADERMAEAIRRISVREGYDPAEYALVAFGGAGGLHACAVARRLGIPRVLHPADSGLLSAFGLGQAVEERIVSRQILRPLAAVQADVEGFADTLAEQGRAELLDAGVALRDIAVRRSEAELRLAGQDTGLVVALEPVDRLEQRFRDAFVGRYGYVPQERAIEMVMVRVVVSTQPPSAEPEQFTTAPGGDAVIAPSRVYARGDLPAGAQLVGEALVQDRFSTLFIEPGWNSIVGSSGSILLRAARHEVVDTAARLESVELELFTSRYRALVEEMAVLLRRCALSVNVKERLDFSCALLDPEAELVANAPNVPVHLGALGLCVRQVVQVLDLQPGDVAITNHPGFGGAHLPDVTLIAPVHGPGGDLLGYVANRAHHAEFGGIRPGSMPPDARNLAEEGVVLAPRFLVRAGRAAWDEIRALLADGLYPSRRVEENVADLHAQLASLRRGADALVELSSRHGVESVLRHMRLLKRRAADALARALDRSLQHPVSATDAMDDGTPVVVELRREASGRLVVDFAGSGAVHPGNLNATPAIVRSALIYVLRVLAGSDLPLNEGLMRDVDLRIPEGLLSPVFGPDASHCPAVVGGNVETSQRVVDVLIRALGLAASSQGTMNNLVFGNARFSIYETVGGGTGAGEGFYGCDGVHSHMTNTAITDPEILESRVPVRVERFAMRRGSGGEGLYRGGDGLERRLFFLEPVELCLLTQRRTSGPPGLHGGGSGTPGSQWVERCNGRREELGASVAIHLGAGDRVIMRTPGGGGWGNEFYESSPNKSAAESWCGKDAPRNA